MRSIKEQVKCPENPSAALKIDTKRSRYYWVTLLLVMLCSLEAVSE